MSVTVSPFLSLSLSLSFSFERVQVLSSSSLCFLLLSATYKLFLTLSLFERRKLRFKNSTKVNILLQALPFLKFCGENKLLSCL